MSSTPYKSWLREDELRIVRIPPGRWDEPLVGNLITCRFALASTFCPYTALSYVWGTASVTEIIDLDGVRFNVTLNLLCALKHLRDRNRATLLWVDALCINQGNETERSQQVKIMQNIYENARQVIVFIGDGRGHRVDRTRLRRSPPSPETTIYGDERDRGLLADLLRSYRAVQPGRRVESIPGDMSAIGLIRGVSDRDTIETFLMELIKVSKAARSHIFECLRAFVVCPWWARIWVVQEVTVNNNVVVRYGNLKIPWLVFVQAADTWSMPQTRALAHRTALEEENIKVFDLFVAQVSGLERTRRRWRAGGGISLVSLLQEFSHRQASDDRDKVYGLLSLTTQHLRPYIVPDYGADVFETYLTAALAVIQAEESLACWCGDQRRKNHRDLPSWVPDWSTAFDPGDRRRMSRTVSSGANCGWNLKLVNTEESYWAVVSRDMMRLLDSPACRSGRLPASLRLSLGQYIDILDHEKQNISRRSRAYIEDVICQCRELSSLCNATETTIKLCNLFRSSFIFRGGDTYRLAKIQLEKADEVQQGVSGISHCVPDLENVLTIQGIVTDCVINCGIRLLGWADKESAFSVLFSWLSVLRERCTLLRTSGQQWPFPERREPVRVFAETLLGGLCWRNGSYHKAAQVDLSALENWIRLSLVTEKFSMPPSAFLEDIQVATDGRVFFLTKNGSMGLAPASIQNGDTIHVFPGDRTHFALRKKFGSYDISDEHTTLKSMQDIDSRCYALIGDCYLHSDIFAESQAPDDEDTAIDGSLPFEFLGQISLDGASPKVDTIVLV